MRPNEPVIVGTGHTRFGKLQEGLEQLMHLVERGAPRCGQGGAVVNCVSILECVKT